MAINRLNDKVEVWQCAEWMGDCHISHFSTTRFGGVSQGAFGGMNAGRYTDDDPTHVQQNVEWLCEALHLSPERLLMPHQTHGTCIRKVDASFLQETKRAQEEALEGVDALATDVPGVCVAVSTADCVPVLLYAPDKQVVAAVHAGWRGVVQGIVPRTVAFCRAEYGCDASQMEAVIGPSISQAAFEVGEEVVEQFRQSQAWTKEDTESLFRKHPETGKTHIDLWRGVQLQLCQKGLVENRIHLAGICTYQQADRFFSARRLGIRSGRILSGIWLHAR